ncbi:tetratricopeptide repeat protein [Planctomycetota bacterium]
MFSRTRSKILSKYDASLRKVHDVNREAGRKFRSAFWKSGIVGAYYKSLGLFGKIVESVGFFFGFVGHIFLSTTVHSSTADSIRKAGDKTAQKVNQSWADLARNIGEKAEKSSFTAWLVTLIRLAKQLFHTAFGFCIDWLWTRNFWLLLGAIPAIAMSLPVAYFLVRIPLQNPRAISKSYQKAVHVAIEAEDFDAVALYNRRIAQLGDRPVDGMAYRSAMKLQEKGKLDDAYAQMRSIAPTNRPGYAAAHMWIADNLMSGDIRKADQTDEQVNALIRSHLEYVMTLEPDYPRASRTLAAVHMADGDNESALALLNENRHKYVEPIDRLRVSDLYHTLGKHEIAAELFRSAEETAKTREQIESDLPAIHYIGKAEIQFQKGQLDAAIGTLTTAREIHPENQGIASYLVTLRRTRYDMNQSIYAPHERLKKLSELLEISPTDTETLSRISVLAESPIVSSDAEQLLEVASQHENVDKTAVFKFLGSAYAVRGKLAESRQAFERVLETNPREGESLNNLAWLYAHEPPILLERALEYSQRAIAIDPENPHYRDTLGHIFMLTGQWDKAVGELRNALNGMPDNKKTHAALAQCYDKLDQSDLAKQHRHMASQ